MITQVMLPSRHERLGYAGVKSRFPFLLIAVCTLTAATVPHRTFGQAQVNGPRKLNSAEKRMVWKLEQQLVTPLKSKDNNPGDRETWYVIVFTDTALGKRQSHTVSGNILTTTREIQAARQSAAKMAHGRKDAALLLLQYYYAGNAAAARLKPTAGGTTDRASAEAVKKWEYRAFATEAEAKALLHLIQPEKKP